MGAISEQSGPDYQGAYINAGGPQRIPGMSGPAPDANAAVAGMPRDSQFPDLVGPSRGVKSNRLKQGLKGLGGGLASGLQAQDQAQARINQGGHADINIPQISPGETSIDWDAGLGRSSHPNNLFFYGES